VAISRDADGRIWLLRRTLHEGAGRWTFPAASVECVRAFEAAELPWDELAFASTERALRDALA
jgi:ADP-ribose pyrophosphatase YjhB (NUDIX family)